jgi:hypothetical protein
MSSLLTEASVKTPSISNAIRLLLTKMYFLKITLYPEEISRRLMASFIENDVAGVHDRQEQINCWKYKTVGPYLDTPIALQMSQQTVLHQHMNKSQVVM